MPHIAISRKYMISALFELYTIKEYDSLVLRTCSSNSVPITGIFLFSVSGFRPFVPARFVCLFTVPKEMEHSQPSMDRSVSLTSDLSKFLKSILTSKI